MLHDEKPLDDIAVRFDIDIEELEQLAAIGYTPESIAMYFKLNLTEFLYHFHRDNSPLKYHYNRGILVHQAKEGMSMLEAAENGNTTQGQRLDKLRYQVNFEQHKQSIIYGNDEDDI